MDSGHETKPARLQGNHQEPERGIRVQCRRRKIIRGKRLRLLLVLTGIILGQAILYGPSLIGQKVLLPLDLLTVPGVYNPGSPKTAAIVPHNVAVSDLIIQSEPSRRFAASEIEQGRFPLWAPYQYAGAPFVLPKFSPFLFLTFLVKSPVIIAWAQLVAALVAGTGMYCFCRRGLRVGFWPAAVCAWIYPLTAFFIFWQGFLTGMAVCWLPWVFLLVDKTVRDGGTLKVAGLSVMTCLTLISGQIDVAGQVLLGAGFYAIWCLWNEHSRALASRKLAKVTSMLVVGWGLGFMLAAPHLLPLLEYAQTGSRMEHRSEGMEERPPYGLASAPQVVLPLVYGDTEKGSLFIPPFNEPNLLESPAAGYCGLLASLLIAPLAWCSRRHRAINFFWLGLVLFGLSWCLNFPGFVSLLRMPGLNMMSHNRLVFLTAFGIVCLAATGLDALLRGSVYRRWWFWLPAGLLAGLFAWGIHLAGHLPEPLATQCEQSLVQGKTFGQINVFGQINNIHDLRQIQGWFIEHYTIMAMLCALGFLGWLLLWFEKSKRSWLFPTLAFLMWGELLWFDYGRNPQCDPALYYPKIQVLDKIAKSLPGRVIGFYCLSAPLAEMAGLDDIRGYDAVDPFRMVTLLESAARSTNRYHYAAVYNLSPSGTFLPPGNFQLSPVLDMLGVRYVIFRGNPPKYIHPPFQGDDYWALINSNALPRAFVPKSVEALTNDHDVFQQVTSPQFDAAAKTFVETPVQLPATCVGNVQITNETPTRIIMNVHMDTPGMVVLADNWDKGWLAAYNGKPAPVLLANYAIRGVIVPVGDGKLEFIYRPASLILGFWLAGFAAIILSVWLAVNGIQHKLQSPGRVVMVKPDVAVS